MKLLQIAQELSEMIVIELRTNQDTEIIDEILLQQIGEIIRLNVLEYFRSYGITEIHPNINPGPGIPTK